MSITLGFEGEYMGEISRQLRAERARKRDLERKSARKAKRAEQSRFLASESRIGGNGNICPACHGDMPREKSRKSLSRYCDRYICPDCGTREAFEGFFWSRNK